MEGRIREVGLGGVTLVKIYTLGEKEKMQILEKNEIANYLILLFHLFHYMRKVYRV